MLATRKLVQVFVAGERPRAVGGSAHTSVASASFDGTVFYSYRTPIAVIDREARRLYMIDRKFSVTTSKQQTYLGGGAAVAGFEVVRVPDGPVWEDALRIHAR